MTLSQIFFRMTPPGIALSGHRSLDLKQRCFGRSFRRIGSRSVWTSFAALCGLASLSFSASAQNSRQILRGHVPALVQSANLVGRVQPSEPVHLALTLPLRNQAALNDLLKRLYDPADPMYGKYLTTEQFKAQFAPTQADYNAVIAYAQAQGLTVTNTHANRLVVDVSAPAQNVEAAFALRLKQYQLPTGRIFRAPDSEPVLPASVAGKVQNIVGLDTAEVWQTHNRVKPADPLAFLNAPDNLLPDSGSGAGNSGFAPHVTGSGPGGGLTPSDIKKAYGLSGVSQTGTGQTLALFELDGYKASDITAYESYFGLPNVTLQNVLVDGYSGASGSGAGEVTLDIELQIALAPGASKILVYEGPNSGSGVIDTYNRIATDNLAKSVSTSWGLAENSSSSSTRSSENTIFQQMAAQGQSIFAASGDSGAYDNGSSLSVDDPASQPYMTGVGGTKVTTSGGGGAWSGETTWNGGSIRNGGGGGGISTVWPIPSYQAGFGSAASKASTANRNVPDVSLDADPNNGYAIYFSGGWYIYGGTSCAAPLWSAFTALVNQQRVSAGKGTLGFANPALYAIGKTANYATEFHDIADNSTNLYYPAVSGYDLATGLGTINNGINLLTDLAGGTVTGGGGGGGTTQPTQLLGNPGFENGSSNPAPWVASAGVIDSSTSAPSHGGSWKAWLDGYGTTHTDTVYQQVSIPSTITTATLTFWLRVTSNETSTTTAYDTLNVQVRNSSGAVLATLATYSNLNKASAYSQKTFDLSAYKGQTIQVYLVGVENSSKATSFLVDDFALNAQ